MADGVLIAHFARMNRPGAGATLFHRRSGTLACAIAILVCSWIGSAAGQNLVRVPADTANFQDAMARVTDGGTVELGSGVYTAPVGGFTNPAGKGMTIQAANGRSEERRVGKECR